MKYLLQNGLNKDNKEYFHGDIIELSQDKANELINAGAQLQEYNETRLTAIQVNTSKLIAYLKNCGKIGGLIITSDGNVVSSSTNDDPIQTLFDPTELIYSTSIEKIDVAIAGLLSKLKDNIIRTGRIKGFNISFV